MIKKENKPDNGKSEAIDKTQPEYGGFEQGPIRPPSEAHSLLIRVTRNCPWNKCTFCPVYKDAPFSIRPKEHVIQDIDTVHKYVSLLLEQTGGARPVTQADADAVVKHMVPQEQHAFYAAATWAVNGMESIFLQDANSLVVKPGNLIALLKHLRHRFPQVKRITSYARSQTLSRTAPHHLKEMADAGLNRIHVGMESGSDEVLSMIQKGTTRTMHIEAGLKVKAAGMELSEYVMPGLGGRDMWEIHALDTADALNQINPHFIRLRTLAIPNHSALFDALQKGTFKKNTDLMTVKEILLFIESLEDITSTLQSDHILNLFQELEGTFPEDKEPMIKLIKDFLNMSPQDQCTFQMGRRLGVFSTLNDMKNDHKRGYVEDACRQIGVTPETIDKTTDEIIKRFV